MREKNDVLMRAYPAMARRAFALALAAVLFALLTIPQFRVTSSLPAEARDTLIVIEIPETDVPPPPTMDRIVRPNPEIIEASDSSHADTTTLIVSTDIKNGLDSVRIDLHVDRDPPLGAFIAYDVRPKPVQLAQPEYPEIPLQAGIEAVVYVSILLDREGKPMRAVVKKSAGMGFDEAAIDAAMGSRFTPAYQRDVPVKSWITIGVRFDIKR